MKNETEFFFWEGQQKTNEYIRHSYWKYKYPIKWKLMIIKRTNNGMKFKKKKYSMNFQNWNVKKKFTYLIEY